jgi:hypothetical protein
LKLTIKAITKKNAEAQTQTVAAVHAVRQAAAVAEAAHEAETVPHLHADAAPQVAEKDAAPQVAAEAKVALPHLLLAHAAAVKNVNAGY